MLLFRLRGNKYLNPSRNLITNLTNVDIGSNVDQINVQWGKEIYFAVVLYTGTEMCK